MRVHAFRLLPGVDLKQSILQAAQARGFTASVVLSGVGSLGAAYLRFAAQPTGTHLPGPYEIVSLTGTVAENGATCHLHVSLSDEAGRTLGGHLLDGCVVRTTAEIVLAELPGARFRREIDPMTGYAELVVESA